jgi:protein-tyrosine phosphatase
MLDSTETELRNFSNEELGLKIQDMVAGICQNLADLRPLVEEAWRRLEDGQVVSGCQTKKEFSEKILGRTYRAVRYMLDGGNRNRSETVSLPEPTEEENDGFDDPFAAPEPPAAEAETPADPEPEDSPQNGMFDLQSALQKAIRRSGEREALLAAWQLDAEASITHTKGRAGGMWSILRRICAEDIGLANTESLEVVETLWRFWQKQLESFQNHHEPWRLFTVEAVMVLCQSPKSRRVDHACIVLGKNRLESIVQELRQVKQPHPIPEYAHDGIHTGVGNGKTVADFIVTENAALTPKVELDDPYLREIENRLETAAAPLEPKKSGWGAPTAEASQITDLIFLGSRTHAKNLYEENPLGIQAVLSVVESRQAYKRRADVEYLDVPLEDTEPVSPENFRTCQDFIQRHVQAGNKILVHCAHGRNRSTGIVVGFFLATKRFVNWKDGFAFVKSKRSIVQCNSKIRESILVALTVHPCIDHCGLVAGHKTPCKRELDPGELYVDGGTDCGDATKGSGTMQPELRRHVHARAQPGRLAL